MSGRVLAIALRDGTLGPMIEVAEATATADGGIEPNHRVSAKRGLTLIAKDRWEAAVAEIHAEELPWHTRRANLLVNGIELADLIGRTIRIGETVRVAIHGETEPCALMDNLHPGLRAALEPDCRGGVYGRIVTGGAIRAGDEVAADDMA